MKTTLPKLLVGFACLLLVCGSVQAEILMWKTAVTAGNWDDGNNWTNLTPSGTRLYPQAGDTAIISNTAATTLNLDGAQAASVLSNYSSANLTISNGTLALDGAGTNFYRTATAGNLTINADVTITLPGHSTFYVNGTGSSQTFLYGLINGTDCDLTIEGTSRYVSFRNATGNGFRDLYLITGDIFLQGAGLVCAGTNVVVGDGVGAENSARMLFVISGNPLGLNTKQLIIKVPHQNLWVTAGSGSCPSV